MDVKAHAIIYSGRDAPDRLANEPRMDKAPVAVDCTEDQKLHVASRINFARVTTVEHNVRVLKIGRIRPSSQDHFESYWRQELMD